MSHASATATAALEPVTDRGWRRGLWNLVSAGFRSWWGTSTWWIQVLIWLGVTVVPLAALLFSEGSTDETPALTIFGIMAMFAAVAVAIIMQDEIVGEKKSGTAAWVLSKPVSRAAFVLAKLIPNAVGVLVTMVIVPGIAAYALVAAAGEPVEPLGYLAGLGVVYLNLLFYLTLTLMLGTFFDSAGPVIGIALGFAFGQQLLIQIPFLAQVLPWALVAPIDQNPVSDASALMVGQPMPMPLAVPVAALACVAFVILAIRRFERTEL
jgi:ABC-2 type transport system permease protein